MAKNLLIVVLSAGCASALNIAGLGSFNSHQLDSPLLYARAAPLPFCNSTQIINMDMTGCECRGQQTGCTGKDSTDCSVCNGLSAIKNVTSCDGGCTDKESSCQGCGLWFHSLCDCLKNPQWCTVTSAAIKKNDSPIWVLLSQPGASENLTTTNLRVSGILDTYEKPKFFDAGWAFSQSVYKAQDQALAMNSVRVRTHEQIHTHICRRNDDLYDKLASEHIKNFNSVNMTRLESDPELYCVAVQNGGIVQDFSSALGRFFEAHPHTCKERIGAGILQDKYKNTWACATNSSSGPLGKFCHHY